jgi:hypothetical protein
LKVVGLLPDEQPTLVRAESSSTSVKSVIQQALNNVGKLNESADDYCLLEVNNDDPTVRVELRGYRGEGGDLITSDGTLATRPNPQKLLPHSEAILDTVGTRMSSCFCLHSTTYS